jgi:hypothetical protein
MNQGKMVIIGLAFVCLFARGIGAQTLQLRPDAASTGGTQLISLTVPESASGNHLSDFIMPILPPNDDNNNPISGAGPITVVPEPSTMAFVLVGFSLSAVLLRYRRSWRA